MSSKSWTVLGIKKKIAFFLLLSFLEYLPLIFRPHKWAYKLHGYNFILQYYYYYQPVVELWLASLDIFFPSNDATEILFAVLSWFVYTLLSKTLRLDMTRTRIYQEFSRTLAKVRKEI